MWCWMTRLFLLSSLKGCLASFWPVIKFLVSLSFHGLFSFFGFINNSFMNGHRQAFLYTSCIFIFLWKIPRTGIVSLYGKSILNFSRSYQTVFQSGNTIFHSSTKGWKLSFCTSSEILNNTSLVFSCTPLYVWSFFAALMGRCVHFSND